MRTGLNDVIGPGVPQAIRPPRVGFHSPSGTGSSERKRLTPFWTPRSTVSAAISTITSFSTTTSLMTSFSTTLSTSTSWISVTVTIFSTWTSLMTSFSTILSTGISTGTSIVWTSVSPHAASAATPTPPARAKAPPRRTFRRLRDFPRTIVFLSTRRLSRLVRARIPVCAGDLDRTDSVGRGSFWSSFPRPRESRDSLNKSMDATPIRSPPYRVRGRR